jgi:hypothetical protein
MSAQHATTMNKNRARELHWSLTQATRLGLVAFHGFLYRGVFQHPAVKTDAREPGHEMCILSTRCSNKISQREPAELVIPDFQNEITDSLSCMFWHLCWPVNGCATYSTESRHGNQVACKLISRLMQQMHINNSTLPLTSDTQLQQQSIRIAYIPVIVAKNFYKCRRLWLQKSAQN